MINTEPTEKTSRPILLRSVLLGLVVMLSGCSGEDETGSGSLSVLLEAEAVIIEGLAAGDGAEDIRDGWTVSFDKYLATVGDIDLHLSTDESVDAEAEEAFVVDLTTLPSAGLELWSFEGLREGRWEFNYSTPGAGDGATRHKSASKDDFDEMVENDWTYLIDGELSKDDGESCPPAALADAGDSEPNGNTSGNNDCYDAPSVRFSFGASVETTFGPCKIDEVPGVSISAGATQTVAATIHGDHPFFNGFPEGGEGGVRRLAQWLADCDLDLDGVVTLQELKAIAPSDLPEVNDRYQLGGSPIKPLDNMYDYLRSQLKTQGHYQGEGECPVDGVEQNDGHDHDHDDEDDHGE